MKQTFIKDDFYLKPYQFYYREVFFSLANWEITISFIWIRDPKLLYHVRYI